MLNKFRTRIPVASAIAALLLPPLLHGEVITPVSATSTSTIGSPRTIDATIDGTLLSGGGTSGDILAETVSYAGSAGHWLSASSAVDDDADFRSTTEVLTFDLGGSFDLDSFHLWPYVRSESVRGLSSFDLSFSTDGGATFPTTITLSGWTIGTSSGEPVQTQTFAPQTGVTHVRMTNLTTFGSTNYIAISELRLGGVDTSPPSLTTTGPADEATGVVVSSNLTATFDEDIALADGGTVTIRNLGPSGAADEVITIPDARLSVSGPALIIDPAGDLEANNNYAVQISADAVVDLAPVPNAFGGILNDIEWNFQTAADTTAPGIVLPTSPADDATDVAVGMNLIANFDEPVVAGSGRIVIKNLTDGSDMVIPVGDSQVTVTGNQLTVAPALNLDPSDDYAIQLDPGVVTDATGNPFAGIVAPDVSSWNFRTAADLISPTITSLSPADGETGVIPTAVLTATFDEPIVAAVPPTSTLLAEDFEGGDGGFTVQTSEGSDWVWGTPDSSSPGGAIASGNGTAPGNGTAWGTNLGAYAGGAGDEGYYAVPTTTCLRSAPIDLAGLGGASLTFAHARDLAAGDTAVVNLIDGTTNAVVAGAIYTATNNSEGWSTTPSIDLADGLGQTVRIEWCLTGTGGGSNDYLGWCVDDVTVTGFGSTDAAITLRNLTANSETVYSTGDAEVAISGNTLAIMSASVLDGGDSYAVRIGTEVLADESGNLFAGIADDTTWNFTVAAGTAIFAPVVATASSTIGSPRLIERTVDGSDLSGGGTSGYVLGETHANNNSNSGGYWLSANTGGNVGGEVLTYELASPSDVNAVHIWGYNRLGNTSRSIRTFDLSFSTDGGATFPTTIPLGDLNRPADPIGVQTLGFALQTGVTDLRISNITNYGDGNYVGLSEIRFGGPSGDGGGNNFSDWIAGFPGVGGQTTLGGDPDGDDIDNGVENFFGTDPGAFSQGLLVASADGGVITITHPQGTLADDLSAAYRWSTDLQTFQTGGVSNGSGTTVEFSSQTDTPVDGTTTVTVTVTAGPVPAALFVDVEVTQN